MSTGGNDESRGLGDVEATVVGSVDVTEVAACSGSTLDLASRPRRLSLSTPRLMMIADLAFIVGMMMMIVVVVVVVVVCERNGEVKASEREKQAHKSPCLTSNKTNG